ncbi:MAG: Small archaeal modifier protein 1 [Methanoregula sp. PtaU1.Bin006]|nr:MAG: Small archaeal modifier protein 1 [Methanoregula sp. PtaU1.Bin006]
MMAEKNDRISVTVKSFATLREVMDREIRLDLAAGATVGILLGELCRKYPGLEPLLFSAPGILRDYVNILRNGRNIEFLTGLSTRLDDGDMIALFPPAAGG